MGTWFYSRYSHSKPAFDGNDRYFLGAKNIQWLIRLKRIITTSNDCDMDVVSRVSKNSHTCLCTLHSFMIVPPAFMLRTYSLIAYEKSFLGCNGV